MSFTGKFLRLEKGKILSHIQKPETDSWIQFIKIHQNQIGNNSHLSCLSAISLLGFPYQHPAKGCGVTSLQRWEGSWNAPLRLLRCGARLQGVTDLNHRKIRKFNLSMNWMMNNNLLMLFVVSESGINNWFLRRGTQEALQGTWQFRVFGNSNQEEDHQDQ